MSTSPSRALALAGAAAAVAVLVLLPSGRAVSQELVHAIVDNWPSVWNVEGRVQVTGGPLAQTQIVRITEVVVPPVSRRDTNRLIAGGTIDASGFPAVVLSLSGEVKAEATRGGDIGALLVPEEEAILRVFDERGRVQFPLEVTATWPGGANPYFESDQPRYVLGFPRYRVLFWNHTDRTATVNLYAHLTP